MSTSTSCPGTRPSVARVEPVSAAAVTVRGLVKRFGPTTAVDGLDLELQAASVLALLGPNGAGKTTTVEICTGLPRRRRGRGTGARHQPQGRARRAARPHRRDAPGRRRLPRRAGGRDAAPGRGLLGAAARPGGGCSTCWASPAARAPRTSGCPAGSSNGSRWPAPSSAVRSWCSSTSQPRASIRRPDAWCGSWSSALRRDGVAVLLTTHLMEEAEALADDVVIVDNGRVVAHGSPAALTSTGPQQELRFRAQARHGPHRARHRAARRATTPPSPSRAATSCRAGSTPACSPRSPLGARSRAPSPTTSRWRAAASRTCSSSSPGGSCAHDHPALRPPGTFTPAPGPGPSARRCSSPSGHRAAARVARRRAGAAHAAHPDGAADRAHARDARAAARPAGRRGHPGGARAGGDVHGVHRRRPSRSASTAATA